MVSNQKPRKLIILTKNSSTNTPGYGQPTKELMCYNLPLHTHDEDNFHHPQILKIASGTHTEWILNRNNTQYQNSQQNYRSSTRKHQRQIKQVQSTEKTQLDPPAIDNTETTELQLNHVIYESTDDESKTETMLSIIMLQIENEYETPLESNYCQNNNNHFQNPYNIQEKTVYTEQELNGSSSTNNIYQNTLNTIQITKKNFGQSHFS